MRFVGGLILGLIGGYCVVLFGWIAYMELTSFHDFEGASSMGVAFGIAPLGAVIAGLALGIFWQLRKPR